MTNKFVVAYIGSINGMASWCWEAAHALHELGEEVLLVCAKDIKIPDQPAVEVLRFEPPPRATPSNVLLRKVHSAQSLLDQRPSHLLYELDTYLRGQATTPTAYFLNAPNFQDSRVQAPQYVVGWAYPTSFLAYVVKLGKYSKDGWKLTNTTLMTLFFLMGVYRKDWRGYRNATAVLAVSHRLGKELAAQGVNTHVVHPGTAFNTTELIPSHPPIKLLITSLDLEDRNRKRVPWMLEALKLLPKDNWTLTLVGQASNSFKTWVHTIGLPATFTGYLPRNQVQAIMKEHDVFLFGSCLDDWGYVLVEAMCQGLCVLAPNLSPFDEIVGDVECLYVFDSQEDFRRKLLGILTSDIGKNRYSALRRSEQLFSRQEFAKNLIEVFAKTHTLSTPKNS